MTVDDQLSVAPSEQDGVVAGRYALRRLIARGQFADVHFAFDRERDCDVIVKLLLESFASDPEFTERFDRDVQAMIGLRHQNLVTTLDAGVSAGRRFVAQEFVAGGTLAELMHQRSTFDPSEAARLAAEVAAGLEYAHRHGFLHGDLKPTSVLLSADLHAKLADVGFAHADDPGAPTTLVGVAMGNATYFSPEQAMGQRVTALSDLYSLGVILYQMATGRPPFVGISPLAVADKHVHEDVIPPRWMHAGIPVALESIILRSLAKNPAERYGSAAELGVDLDRFLKGQTMGPPLGAATASTATAMSEPHRVPSIEGATSAPSLRTASPTLPPSVPRRARRGHGALALAALILLGGAGAYVARLATSHGVIRYGVPKVAGLSQAAATAVIHSLGLQAVVRTTPVPPNEVGRVVAQTPAAAVQLPRGAKVVLTLGVPRSIAVPSVAKLPFAAAVAELTRAGFAVTPHYVAATSPSQVNGTVVGEQPATGTHQSAGSTVMLDVVRLVKVDVPQVQNLTLAEAAVLLQQSGLVVGAKFASLPSSTVATGLVISSQPAPPAQVPKGSTVQLSISSGVPTAAPTPGNLVPTVTGERVQQAARDIKAGGLNYRVVHEVTTRASQDGRVARTAPRGGTSAAAGTVVVMTVWSYSPASGPAPATPSTVSVTPST